MAARKAADQQAAFLASLTQMIASIDQKMTTQQASLSAQQASLVEKVKLNSIHMHTLNFTFLDWCWTLDHDFDRITFELGRTQFEEFKAQMQDQAKASQETIASLQHSISASGSASGSSPVSASTSASADSQEMITPQARKPKRKTKGGKGRRRLKDTPLATLVRLWINEQARSTDPCVFNICWIAFPIACERP